MLLQIAVVCYYSLALHVHAAKLNTAWFLLQGGLPETLGNPLPLKPATI